MPMRLTCKSFLVAIFFLLPGWQAVVQASDKPPLLFGVFPFLPPAQLEDLYVPVAIDLSDTIDQPVQFRTRPSFSDFDNELAGETYDLVFIQPFSYARFSGDAGYITIARRGNPMRAVIVTTEDSPVKVIDDLQNGVLAAPPSSAAVSLLGIEMLLENNLQPGADPDMDYQNSHFACLRRVLIGKADACVTAGRPLSLFQEKSGIRFRTVAESRNIPASTFAVHRRIDPRLRDKIARRITGWHNHPEGRKILSILHQPYYEPSSDSDYDPVRKILEDMRKAGLPEPEAGSSR